MITYASEEVAEENRASFLSALRSLAARRGGGVEYYQVRGSTVVEYDPVENAFFHHVELHGYRPHSLGGLTPMKPSDEDDLWQEVGLGLSEIYIVSCYSGDTERYWHGVYNMDVIPARRA